MLQMQLHVCVFLKKTPATLVDVLMWFVVVLFYLPAHGSGHNKGLRLLLLLHVFVLLAAATVGFGRYKFAAVFLYAMNALLILRPMACNPLFASMERLEMVSRRMCICY